MKKRILVLIILTVIGLGIIDGTFKPKIDLWTYDKLPNKYIIEKKSETNVVLSNSNNKIIINEYIAEFSYGKRYIGLKCLEPNEEENTINIKFYIVDSKTNEVYGPYNLESTYLDEKERFVTEELSDWIKTIEITY